MNFPKSILMISPDYFDVIYQINNHMSGKDPVNKNLATLQWNSIKDTYEQLGFYVQVIDGAAEFPDMVFSAKISFFPHLNIFFIVTCGTPSGRVKWK